MKLSLNWLKEYIDINVTPQELSHILTMAGLEVEALERIGSVSEKVIVARVLSVKRHPNADRLSLCEVNTGNNTVQVVCGAPNVKDGMIVAMALPGAVLKGGLTIKESKLRGEFSGGMICAEDELGLTDDHKGIMILPDELEIGASLSNAMDLDDWSIEVSLTPNRPDCASVIGIAREVSALTGQKLRLPDIQYIEKGLPIDQAAKVDVADPKGCPRYAAGMIQNVTLKTSPFWMRYRLHVSGTRSKNNIVDISNYVLLETGQPLHTFDYDQLHEHRIVVARAKDGEKFFTLDGQERTLNKEHLMICDGKKPVGVAGIMGGLNSEISDSTKNILIESAYFNPVTIRKGAKALGISSEASYRFERGVDIEGVIFALKRALSLSLNLAGGSINKGIIDVYPDKYSSPVIDLRVKKTNTFLGSSISKDEMVSWLAALNMKVSEKDDDTITVTPPTYRVDIEREIDLVEEVARMHGYDNIPETYPAIRPSDKSDMPLLTLHDRACDILAGTGFSEVITFSFFSPDSANLLGAGEGSTVRSFVKLMNPLTSEQSVMRTSLLPGLFSTVKENISHGETNLKLFEWGKIYLKNDSKELPDEKVTLAGVMSGNYDKKKWHNETRPVDFYDLKGALEVLFDSLGLNDVSYKRKEISEAYDKNTSCNICFKDSVIGIMGKIKPDVRDRFDLKTGSLYTFELDIEKLLEAISVNKFSYRYFGKYPAVFRDISIIVDKKVESMPIKGIIQKVGGGLVESAEIFSIYEGEKFGPDKKALSYRICYRSNEETLDGERINRLHEKVIESIKEETGGTLSEG
ncbi:MAG: phenylalanine--tRNA ligase subunit beta [Deltaproteobacteria bacterium]|nr:phenylalanine--tRNA ligase subunit beta [Deltaproteobacteria bacterium]